MPREIVPAYERVMRRTEVQPSGCLYFMGARRTTGYGAVGVDSGKVAQAHRVVWEHHNGAIPPGMVIMHLCDNKPCVNIDHLRCDTQSANLRDMVAKGRHVIGRSRHADKTHCPQGHSYAEYGRIRIYKGLRAGGVTVDQPGRVCMECNRIRDRARRPRQGASS